MLAGGRNLNSVKKSKSFYEKFMMHHILNRTVYYKVTFKP